jgi:mutual gliding-motility protein MglA
LRVYGVKNMIMNYKKKEISLKIVYYGCALSGKTTSLKSLFHGFDKGDKLISIETTTGRTLFFDFGTLQIKGGEWTVKILLYSATGQDFYASTRPATLSGADGIIFLVDSQKEYFLDNVASWKELNNYYSGHLSKIPVIICLNKQDLPDLVEMDHVIDELELKQYDQIAIVKTIATNNIGVVKAFKKMLQFIFPSIIIK